MHWLWQVDRDLFRLVHGWRSDWLDPIMWAITSTGLGHVQGVALVVLWVWEARNPRTRSGWLVAPSLLLAGVSAGVVRLFLVRWIDRQRPSNFDFARPMEQVFGNSSFPSGHTTTSFAIAVMLFLLLRKSPHAWVGWCALLWASIVGVSRVYVGVHFPTDVVAAAGLGCSFAALSYAVLSRAKKLPSDLTRAAKDAAG